MTSAPSPAHIRHEYIQRATGAKMWERPLGDRLVGLVYSRVRERAPRLFTALTSRRATDFLSTIHYDIRRRCDGRALLARIGADAAECLDPPECLDTPRKVFERRIRYWQCRPMEDDESAVVSPADARVLIGSLAEQHLLFLKENFFSGAELLGHKDPWAPRFAHGDYAIFRLTPDKYHYNHLPVSGRVIDIYTIDGEFHSCNPAAVLALGLLHARNRRVVTVFDTDVPEGSGVGLVAMVEVVAMMIGDIVQCYSDERYDAPRPLAPGMFLKKGQPKSLYRPGSSTDVLLFEPGRIRFAADLRQHGRRVDVQSRYSMGLGRPLVEIDLRLRSTIGHGRLLPPTTSPCTALSCRRHSSSPC
ncbi:MAG: phosphatidylserine decarboxylase [Desulfobulbaceae bacterium A2]|nr:MAG: phosphatidylserine decarboxylase [Desulfobulbaceae bacterium A2]